MEVAIHQRSYYSIIEGKELQAKRICTINKVNSLIVIQLAKKRSLLINIILVNEVELHK